MKKSVKNHCKTNFLQGSRLEDYHGYSVIIFSNSKLSSYKVRKIIWCFCVDVNTSKTTVLLGHNRNTINDWFNVFRQVIYNDQEVLKQKLVGKIEVDESYFGATRLRGFHSKLKRGRGTPVFGIFGVMGECILKSYLTVRKATLQTVIKGKVSLEGLIYSDGWRGYNGLVDVGYSKHFRVSHGENEFARDGHCHS